MGRGAQAEFEEKTDKGYYERIKPLLEGIPERNGCRYYKPFAVKIGIVADRFLYDSFKDASEFVFITPNGWEKQIENIDVLLIVSVWNGLNRMCCRMRLMWSGLRLRMVRNYTSQVLPKCGLC